MKSPLFLRRLKKPAVFAGLCAVLLSPVPLPTTADQSDAGLDGLFAELQQDLAPARAEAVTRQIWSAWTRAGDPAINARMTAAAQAMAARDFAAAVAELDEVIAGAPRFAEGWNRRATAHYLAGNYQLSLADVARTLDLEPRHFGALSGRGLIHMQLEQYRQAIESFRRALRHNPHLDSVRVNLRAAEKALYGDPV